MKNIEEAKGPRNAETEEGRCMDPIDPHVEEEEANQEQVRAQKGYRYEHAYLEVEKLFRVH